MKKVLKWLGVVVLLPVLLIALLAVLLYVPPVQNWAVKQVRSEERRVGKECSISCSSRCNATPSPG